MLAAHTDRLAALVHVHFHSDIFFVYFLPSPLCSQVLDAFVFIYNTVSTINLWFVGIQKRDYLFHNRFYVLFINLCKQEPVDKVSEKSKIARARSILKRAGGYSKICNMVGMSIRHGLMPTIAQSRMSVFKNNK